MSLYALRLRLPDRPGALGSVASRIGSVGADVVSIDVIERLGASVVDRVLVELVEDTLLDLLVREICQVDDVVLEHLAKAEHNVVDRATEGLRVAGALAAAATTADRLAALCSGAKRLLDADGVIVAGTERGDVLASTATGDDAPVYETTCGELRVIVHRATPLHSVEIEMLDLLLALALVAPEGCG